jgi:D-amino-acid oxidase
MTPTVTIAGAGVIGLTTALRLLEAGAKVTIVARDLPPHTTSNVAAAFWHPYEAGPVEAVERWARRSLDVFRELAAARVPGISEREGLMVFVASTAEPASLRGLPGVRRARGDELPDPRFRAGWYFPSVLAETDLFLAWLVERVRERGATIARRTVTRLEELGGDAVVDATGVWARELNGDTELHALRGQVVSIAPLESRDIVVQDEPGHPITYVVPRSRDAILGGTADLDQWDTQPDPAITERIVERCAALAPEVRSRRVLGAKVGLRPKRANVRLERATLADGRPVVHNYGHGGAGITLAWGCADDATQLLLS